MSAVRIALSNDFDIAVQGLAAMLQEHADEVEVVTITTDPVPSEDVDVILYDTFGRLPDDEKLREMVAANSAQVIVYTWSTYPADAYFADGAAGCVHKGVTGKELVEAIIAVHKGRVVRPQPQKDDEMPAWPGQEHGLSARESEALVFVARGLTNQEIAARAYLSINTVKTYIRTAYSKIGVHSRSQAVRWALDHGLGEVS